MSESAPRDAWADFLEELGFHEHLASQPNLSLSYPQLDRDAEFENVVTQAVNEFTRQERQFWLELNEEDRPIFMPPGDPHKDIKLFYHAETHQRFYYKFLFTLKGLKPCSLLHHESPAAHAILNAFVREKFEPIFNRFRLAQYGFILKMVDHPVSTETHAGFGGSWLFADTRNERWELVEDMFLVDHGSREHKEIDVAKTLGYPVSSESNAGTIRYKDPAEHAALKSCLNNESDPGPVVVLEYDAPGGRRDYEMAVRHFHECRDAVRTHLPAALPGNGPALVLDLSDHPAFSAYSTSSSSTSTR